MKNSLLRCIVAIILVGSLQACEYHDEPATDLKVPESQVAGLVKKASAKLPFEAPFARAMVRKGEVIASYRKEKEYLVERDGFVCLSTAAESFYRLLYEQIINTRIMAPVKMTESYFVSESPVTRVCDPQTYAAYTTAGICHSMEDMVSFARAFQAGLIVSERGFREILTQLEEAREFTRDWQISRRDGRLMADNAGGRSVVLMRFPDTASIGVFLSCTAAESVVNISFKAAEKAWNAV